MNISVIGCGKIGLAMVVNYASSHKVVAIDSNPKTISMLQHGKCPSTETGVADELGKVSKNIYPSTSYQPAKDTRVTVIMLPSPSDEHDKFVSTYVEAACISLRDVFRRDDKPHTIIISTTLMPGTMDKVILPIFKDCPNVDLCYSPVFVALGSVLNGLRKPDSIIIGQQNDEAGEVAETLLNTSTYGTPDIVKTNFINAELSKLLLNCFITAKISLANSCADICERFDNADANVVLNFLGKDKRIGSKTIMPGLGFGGTCVPPETLVQTANGLQRIESIKIGDTVLSHDGLFHKVTQTFRRPYEGDMVKITAGGFASNPMYLTPEHPVWSAISHFKNETRHKVVLNSNDGYKRNPYRLGYSDGHSNIGFYPAKDLQHGDIVALPSLRNQDVFSIPIMKLRTHWLTKVPALQEVTPELMRLFGYYLSEGSTWGKTIVFSFHKRETGYVEDISYIINKYFGCKTSIHKREGNGIKTRTTCISLAEYLHDTFGHKCYQKQIPNEWINLPEEHLRELMKGLWYGDGYSKGNNYTLGITSKPLYNQTKLVLLKLRIPFYTKEYAPRIDKNNVNHRACYFISVSNPDAVRQMNELLPAMANNVEGKSKKTIWFEKDIMLSHIRNIERIPYKGDVCNLEVEDANSYVLEGGTVHNCFGRDSKALIAMGRDIKLPNTIQQSIDVFNDKHDESVVTKVVRIISTIKNPCVGVLGLTYKTDVDLVDDSNALRIAQKISACGVTVKVYDPKGMEAAKKEVPMSRNFIYCDSMQECINDADLVLLATPWKEFIDADFSTMRHKQVLDCWRLWDKSTLESNGVKYYAVGLG